MLSIHPEVLKLIVVFIYFTKKKIISKLAMHPMQLFLSIELQYLINTRLSKRKNERYNNTKKYNSYIQTAV
jgi:hypothetical protein